MKRKRRIWGVLLLITALIIIQLPVSEADAATSASDFRMEGNTLVNYRGAETNVSVPDTVTVIGESAFEDNDTVELVVLPNSVRRIEPYAFWGCERLDTVVLGRGLTEVGDFSFTQCTGLEQISIPSNVTRIGLSAFADCVNLKDVTIPPEVVDIEENAFDGCYQVTFHCEAGSAGETFAQNFYENQAERPEYEDVPDYQPTEPVPLETPQPTAQPEQLETQVTDEVSGEILGSTRVVANRAVVFLESASSSVIQGTSGIDPTIEAETDDSQSTDSTSATGIPKYTIVDGRVVADQAYYRRENLQQITLPEGIEEIGQFSFARSMLEEIILREGVTTIGYGAFYHCDRLAAVELPDSIQKVEPQAFEHTAWLENFYNSGAEFLVSGGVLIAYNGSVGDVTLPEGIRVIAGEAFQGQTGVESVTLPDSLQMIGEGAFEGCSQLTSIRWGNSCIQIADRAFGGCPLDTESMELPESVQELGVGAFDRMDEIRLSEGQDVAEIHELSAERLSNFSYRGMEGASEGTVGVETSGWEGATAELSGASTSYQLTFREQENLTSWENGFQRNLGDGLPEGFKGYALELTDDSGIPITRLGRQPLTIRIPLPEEYADVNVQILAMDRNGQLERIVVQRVLAGDEVLLRFNLQYVGAIGIYSDQTPYIGEPLADQLLADTVTINSMEGPADLRTQARGLRLAKYLIGAGLACTGMIFVFTGNRIRKRKIK